MKYLPNSRLGLVGNLLDGDTPLKINMKPKNEGLEDDVPFQTGDFQVPAVNFLGCTRLTKNQQKKT